MDLFKILGTIAIDNKSANKSIDETTDKAESSSGSMSGSFKKIGAAVATYLAVDKIVSFGKSCVEAAATVKAQTAQFEAAFGDMQGKASEMFKSIGEETGVLATRLQVVGTGAFSQFKGAGLDAAEALEKTGEYTNLAADAAAYYDMSLEEADSLMRSFIRGNTEAGDRIGLFTSETQRNEAALAKLGKKYLDCTEAEKQMIMLDIASSIYESSGAMGQASREADGYENVTGNLRESWRQFMAVLGTPLLEKVVPILQAITSGISGLVEKFQNGTNPMQVFVDKLSALYGWFKDIASYAAEVFKPVLEDIKNVFSSVKDALQPLVDKVKEYVSSGEAANDITNIVKGAIDGLKSAYDAVKGAIETVVQGFKDAVTWGKEHETAVTLLGVAFGTLTAAIVAYNIAQAIKNAGGIVEIAQLAATAIGVGALTVAETAHTVATTIATAATTAFGAAVAFLTSPITLVVVAIGALIAIGVLLYKNWDVIKAKASELWKNVTEKFTAIKNNVVSKITELKTSAVNKFNEMKSNALEKFESLKSGIKDKIESAKEFVRGAIDKIKSFFKFEWSLPKIKLPHFSISGKFSLNPPSIPHFSVDWYKKAMDNAMILNSPTIFGYSQASGKYLGGGDAGAEVVSGADTLMNMIQASVATQNNALADILYKILEAILAMDANMGGNLREALADMGWKVNDREFARLVRKAVT